MRDLVTNSSVSAFEFEFKIRNNLIRERRLALGLTQKQLAKLVKVSAASISMLENLKRSAKITSPFRPKKDSKKKIGSWREDVLRLAKFFKVSPEDLWKPVMGEIVQPRVVKKIAEPEMLELIARFQDYYLGEHLSLDEFLDKKRMLGRLAESLEVLPDRSSDVLRMRFGLDGEETSVKGISKKYKISGTTVRNIEEKSLNKLKRFFRLVEPPKILKEYNNP